VLQPEQLMVLTLMVLLQLQLQQIHQIHSLVVRISPVQTSMVERLLLGRLMLRQRLQRIR
jgi:hypothetical protein